MATWTVQSIMVKPQESGQTNVVTIVGWLASDTDGVNEARSGGQTEIPTSSETFVSYAELTEQQVLGWVWAVMGDQAKTALEVDLNMQLLYMQNPPAVQLPLPWA